MPCTHSTMTSPPSYPPALCPPQLTDEAEQQEPYTPLPVAPIPVVDLQVLDLEHLVQVCRTWGIFRLINHGLPNRLLRQIKEASVQLFALPFQYKEALFEAPLSYFWGTPALTSAGAALRGGGTTLSLSFVEGVNILPAHLSHLPTQEPKLESFRILMEDYCKRLSRVSSTLFKAVVQTLGLDPGKAEVDYFSETTDVLRTYRYPRLCGQAKHDTWGMQVHTDSSLLSILNEDEVGGFEFLKDDDWFGVEPMPDTLIVNIGDMMQAISDDECRSVKHRVKLSRQYDRHSVCYFVFPPEDRVIHSSSYKPFTYAEFRAQVQADIKTLGFKVGLERFKTPLL